VIVVCRNMSASDIEKLVPNISKSCQFGGSSNKDDEKGGGSSSSSQKKHCMELTKKNVLTMSSEDKGKAIAAGGAGTEIAKLQCVQSFFK
jgi:hypothetical protein